MKPAQISVSVPAAVTMYLTNGPAHHGRDGALVRHEKTGHVVSGVRKQVTGSAGFSLDFLNFHSV